MRIELGRQRIDPGIHLMGAIKCNLYESKSNILFTKINFTPAVNFMQFISY